MPSLLITGAGSTVGGLICRSITQAAFKHIQLVACDSNPRYSNLASHLANEYFQIPPYSDPDYASTVLDLCRSHQIDFILPHTEIEAQQLQPLTRDQQTKAVDSLLGTARTYSRFHTKSEASDTAESIGIPTPKCFAADELSETARYVIKPQLGFGSTGVEILSGRELQSRCPDPRDYIIQEHIDGPEFTVEVFSLNKRYAYIVRERRATRGGICTHGRFEDNYVLSEYVDRIISAYELPVLSNFQFMFRHSTNEFVLTDANLRVAAGTGLSLAAGWDGLGALLSHVGSSRDPWTHFPQRHPTGDSFRSFHDSFFPDQ